jgi:hypothetical protein
VQGPKTLPPKSSTTGLVVRLVEDVTECPRCRRPNVVLRVEGAIHRVVVRRELSGELHGCRSVWRAAG